MNTSREVQQYASDYENRCTERDALQQQLQEALNTGQTGIANDLQSQIASKEEEIKHIAELAETQIEKLLIYCDMKPRIWYGIIKHFYQIGKPQ